VSEPAAVPASPLGDVREEGLRVVRTAAERGVPMRLVGGVAVWARCPSSNLPGLSRSYGDVDVVSLSRDRPEVTRFLEDMGYVADRRFNAIHGAQRLYFMDPTHDRPLDVILDRFAMCHVLDLHDRLDVEPLTIPLAELVLTKLQVVALNDKDLRDLIALFADHSLTGPPPDAIDVARITALLGADWGFEHTARNSLDRLAGALATYDIPEAMRVSVSERITELVMSIDRAPKTIRWRARALLGERVKWYEEPEEIAH
jgi:hypothetical protein